LVATGFQNGIGIVAEGGFVPGQPGGLIGQIISSEEKRQQENYCDGKKSFHNLAHFNLEVGDHKDRAAIEIVDSFDFGGIDRNAVGRGND